uniref:Photosystem II Psb31 protein domain-containing protein n=1 Tax=Trieres chinensis TaxID=1514140 RepID=A0A7S2E970_TRICV|mmetsp:Transcript_13294/g.27467  ORF Transcript_13294/g.27467 Transcript_13294/m.27467 type:complete len:275 (+) Transcript_13294:148-972(+)|eukprot:CAMPEP_0183319588 /NCGR_PEP_ID=MMETSP0160_2-20130417/64069_1 /TAXON_ID=2839 ORGANISM="Odontella Sinensis, Strain Grunow 1884" /NCGR_SAMPLE_ID=MMETSP0160_2 /ASSEMBLY_ACC=CAM_ASM_000250 /LENGTH=274 /DNA_ID=CAMNT_0025486099 /DNA_START=57 /DNA_END=881 /DNA_ORIENTATION=-
MRVSTAAIALSLAASASAFVPSSVSPRQQGASSLSMSTEESRRSMLRSAFAFGTAALLPGVANAGLLDDYGADPSKIKEVKKAEEKSAIAQVKAESIIEPNLRSNYYYPTNKKRYLPRIKRCNDAIPGAAEMIGTGDWEAANDFATKVAEDTILPMKLYTSSLLGGGTNVKVSFTKDMNAAAADFEKAQKKLVKAIAKKDQKGSSAALEDLSEALLAYRTSGRLLGPDGGGDIPSVDEIRRSACRVQGRSFEEKYVKARDARLRETQTTVSEAN